MYLKSSYQIEWNDLRKLAKEINDCLQDTFDELPINLKNPTRQSIYKDIKEIFDILAEQYPKETWAEQFPLLPLKAIEVYKSITESNELFVQIPHDFIDKKLRTLSGNEAKVLLAFYKYASFSEENKGETFVGNQKIAETAGVSLSNIDKYIRPLKEKGFIENISSKYENKKTKTKRIITLRGKSLKSNDNEPL